VTAAASDADVQEPVRILHVADYSSPYTGSFVPLLRTAVDAARASGWQAEVVFGERARECAWASELEQAVPVTFLPSGRRAAGRGLAELLARIEGRVILQSHFSTYDVACALAALRRPHTHVIWHEHSEFSRRPGTVIRNVVRFSLLGRRVDRIVCVAPHIASQVAARGAPSERVTFIPNPVDAWRFPLALADERSEARDRLGIAPGARVLLHFSWDWRRKGGDLVLGALARLHDDGRDDAVAVLVGAGPEASAAAGRLGVADYVRIVAPREHHSELYAAADVFVSCSRHEGMPFAVAEALSRGLAVVATDLAGHRALGTGLRSRRIVASEPEPIAAAIEDLLDREPEAVALDAERAHEWVRANLDPRAWAERIVAIHAELLARGRERTVTPLRFAARRHAVGPTSTTKAAEKE
jgi:glycosyltransferase involved in cell wall biosynthesis